MANQELLLALGGGGARGIAHIGVIRVLEEHGITIRGIAGTSMGAVIGGLYAANALPQYEEFLQNLSMKGVLKLLDPKIPTDGLLDGKKMVKLLRSMLNDVQIEHMPLPFVAVTADLHSGKPVQLKSGDLVESMRASFAIPGVFSPVAFQDKWLVDGAVATPVPVAVARDIQPDLPVLAVNVNAAEFPPLEASLAAIAPRGDENKKKPSILTTLNESIAHMQNQLARFQLELNPPDAPVQPALKGIGLFDFIRSEHIIAEGRRATEEAIHQGLSQQIDQAVKTSGPRRSGWLQRGND